MPRLRTAVFDDQAGRALLVAGLLAAGLIPTIRDGHVLDDMANYLLAAERLLNGDPLYASGDTLPYRYAPWFAILSIQRRLGL